MERNDLMEQFARNATPAQIKDFAKIYDIYVDTYAERWRHDFYDRLRKRFTNEQFETLLNQPKRQMALDKLYKRSEMGNEFADSYPRESECRVLISETEHKKLLANLSEFKRRNTIVGLRWSESKKKYVKTEFELFITDSLYAAKGLYRANGIPLVYDRELVCKTKDEVFKNMFANLE